ncbi:hypothetical protein QBC37DRAFT_432709 [Rhypophila decipiens]|uniref:Uncharacterized protein n=1 Tax=Rhypophila decipiens TaxID=261697 RepID=A0AAN6XWJ1_9PEZI|nr:hypothetical protein QBC37DRAFT_432709 [Rhypophila decipiens]
MLSKRLSICSHLLHRLVLSFALLSQSADALAVPPLALRLIRRDDLPNRATRNDIVAAFVTIIVIIILAVWGIWWLVHAAMRTMNGTVTSSSYGSGSSSSSGKSPSFIDTWENPTHRFFRYWIPTNNPRPRVRNMRGVQVNVQTVYPPGPPPPPPG